MLTRHGFLVLAVSAVALLSPISSARACSVPENYVPPPRGPLVRGEELTLFAGLGVLAGAGTISTGWALDGTGNYPVPTAAIATLPGVAITSYLLMPTAPGGGDCSDGTMQYDEFWARAWIPVVAGIIPGVAAWWLSGSSVDYALAPDIRPGYQGIAFSGRWH